MAGTSKRVASCGVGISVRKGAPKPDISTPQALKRTLLSARAVAYSDPAGGGASGIHFTKVLEQLGIAEQIKAKAKLGRGVPNSEAVVRGEADLAVQQIPELLPVAGTELVGPLPRELQAITTFSAAALATSRSPKAVTALIQFLTSPEAAAVLKAAGFEVAQEHSASSAIHRACDPSFVPTCTPPGWRPHHQSTRSSIKTRSGGRTQFWVVPVATQK